MSYLLDNASELAQTRFGHLETLFDTNSLELLNKYVSENSLVWMPGAGSGSLAPSVGDRLTTGTVHVTDMDTRWFDCQHPKVQAYAHHLLADDYPRADVIHARLVLQHVPGWREDVLPRMVESMNEGGVLIVEELDPAIPYRPFPQSEDEEIVNRIGDGFTRLLELHGADYSNGRVMVQSLREAGLTVTEAYGRQEFGYDRNAAIRLQQTNASQTKDELVSLGIPAENVDRYIRYLETDEAWLMLPVMYSVVARKEKG